MDHKLGAGDRGTKRKGVGVFEQGPLLSYVRLQETRYGTAGMLAADLDATSMSATPVPKQKANMKDKSEDCQKPRWRSTAQ